MTLFYVYPKCDRRRYRKEWRALLQPSPEANPISKAATELDRLAFADIADEHGFEYLAWFVRNMFTTKKKRNTRRRSRS